MFTLELYVAATPAQAFAVIADFASAPRWYSAVQSVARVRGDGGIGTRYAVRRQLPTGPTTNTVDVTEYVDGRDVTFTSIDGPTPFTYRYRIQPAPHGARVEFEGTISAAGLPAARALGPMAENVFRRGMRANLGVLKEILERQ